MMKTSNKFGNDNYNSVIHHLIQNYMQMLDRVDHPLEKLEVCMWREDDSESIACGSANRSLN